HRALHGVDCTGELHQHAVAHHLDYAALMLGYQRLEDALTPFLQRRQRTGLVLLHQAAVADHIRREDGGKAAWNALLSHAGGPPLLLSKSNRRLARVSISAIVISNHCRTV